MKRLPFISTTLVALLCLHGSATGGSICSLPAGDDVFSDSEGIGVIVIPGFPTPIPFAACGATTITRDDPVPSAGNPDSCTIPTEIVSMSLSGVFDPCGLGPGPLPITIVEDPDPGSMSTGAIYSSSTGGLPGSSFFDVYTLVTIPGFGTFSHTVTVVNDTLDAVPPGSASPGGPPCLMPGQDPYEQGFPLHKHEPCPPKLCCQLECGALVAISLDSCRKLGGQPTSQHCLPLCAGNIGVEMRTWGSIKYIYKN